MSQESQRHEYEWDVIVIGGGSGGLGFARRAGSYGAKVMMFEETHVGGTCVNVGCVPKKLLWTAANFGDAMRVEYGAYGWKGGKEGVFDWADHKQKRDAYIKRLHGIYHRNLAKDNVEVVDSRADIVDPHTVRCEKTGKEYTAKYIVLATGGRPRPLDVKGKELAIDSDGFFELEEQPRRVAVIGGGYIAVELVGVFNGLGSDTSLITHPGPVLRGFDRRVVDILLQQMSADGINHVTEADVVEFREEETKQDAEEGGKKTITIVTKDGRTLTGFDKVIYAIGRLPNVTEGMRKVGLQLTEFGHVAVDKYQKTSVDSIFALGDLCGNWQLTPVAIAAGRKLGDRLFGGVEGAHLEYETIPTVMFSHPPVGVVGITEEEAVQKFGAENVFFYQAKFRSMHYALCPQNSDEYQAPSTFVRIIVAGPEEKVVGLHLLGPSVDEMLQGFSVAVKMGATKKDFDNVVAIHPTAAEEVVTLKTRHPSSFL